jgi:hypothetical protein
MKLHVNLDDLTITASPRSRAPIRSLSVRRGDSLTIDVSFSTNGRTGSLPVGSVVSVSAYDGPASRVAIATASTSVAVNRGAKTIYRLSPVSFSLASLSGRIESSRVVQIPFEVRVVNGSLISTTAPVTLNVSQTAS